MMLAIKRLIETLLARKHRPRSVQSKRSGLDLIDAGLAECVKAVDDDVVLRLFACKCASLALEHCSSADPRLAGAVKTARDYAAGAANLDQLEAACADAAEAAQVADNAAFDAQDAVEEGKAPYSAYSKAFGVARAAFSAWDCCLGSATDAAEEAAYEAWHALRTAVEDENVLHRLLPAHLSDDAEIDVALVVVLRQILDKLSSEQNGLVDDPT